MLRFTQLHNLKRSVLSQPVQCYRRFLATETQFSLPPSPQFAAEEQRQTGIVPEKEELTKDQETDYYKKFLSEKKLEAPLRPHLRVEVDPDHGLWAFFRRVEDDEGIVDYQTVQGIIPGQVTSGEMSFLTIFVTPLIKGLGRSWRSYELRRKSFKDLHTLWYIILRERNLLGTQRAEALRLGISYRLIEGVEKDKQVGSMIYLSWT